MYLRCLYLYRMFGRGSGKPSGRVRGHFKNASWPKNSLTLYFFNDIFVIFSVFTEIVPIYLHNIFKVCFRLDDYQTPCIYFWRWLANLGVSDKLRSRTPVEFAWGSFKVSPVIIPLMCRHYCVPARRAIEPP